MPLLQWVSSAPLWLINSLSLSCDQGNASDEKFIKGQLMGKVQDSDLDQPALTHRFRTLCNQAEHRTLSNQETL